MRARYLLPLIAVIGLSGCANWSTLYRKPNFSESDSLLTDIGARAIFVTPRDTKEGQNINLRNTPKTIVCAEPSPDSMQAYAAKLDWKLLSDSAVTRDAALAYSTAASYVGNRTQTVQLLRDQLYRLCEAYANGIIDSDTYTMLMSRSQRYTLALAMIDNSPAPGVPSSITPREPGKDAPSPVVQGTSVSQDSRATPNLPERYLTAIETLVGAGDEGYICLNLLKQRNTTVIQTSSQAKIEQYCATLFDEKMNYLKLQNKSYEEAIKKGNLPAQSAAPATGNRSTIPALVDPRVYRLERILPSQPTPQL